MDFHGSAGLQPILPVDHHLISGRDAAGNQRDIALGQIHLHGLHVGLAGLVTVYT